MIGLRQIEKSDIGFVKSLAESDLRLLIAKFDLSLYDSYILNDDISEDRAFIIYVGADEANMYRAGVCAIQNIDFVSRHGELFFAMPLQGFDGSIPDTTDSKESLNKLISYAFGELGLNKVWIQVPEPNRSLAALEACGFVPEGVKRGAFIHKGKPVPVMVFSLLKAEFGVK